MEDGAADMSVNVETVATAIHFSRKDQFFGLFLSFGPSQVTWKTPVSLSIQSDETYTVKERTMFEFSSAMDGESETVLKVFRQTSNSVLICYNQRKKSKERNLFDL